MSDNLEVLEAKATGEDSMAADPVTPAGGAVKNRNGDLKKKVDPTADRIEDQVKTPQGTNNAGIKEAIDGLFEGMDLTEDFKTKTVAIFEAAVYEKVLAEKATLTEKFESDLAEQVEIVVDDLVEKVDTYLNYVVEQWMEENKVEIESNFKVEVAESLLDGIKGLVAEHNIQIEDEQVDAIAEMEAKVDETVSKYNEIVEELISIKADKKQLEINAAFKDISEGLTDTQAEKLRVLSEGVSFDTIEAYAKKMVAIKDNYFSVAGTPAKDETEFLEESADEPNAPAQKDLLDPSVEAYAKALGRIVK